MTGFNRPEQKFSLWPLVLTSFIALWVCLGLNHFSSSRDIPDFRCHGQFFVPHSSALNDGELQLNIRHHGKDVILEYVYVSDGQIQGNIRLTADLLGLEIASMTYNLMLKEGDFLLDVATSDLPLDIQRLLTTHTRKNSKTMRLPFDIQVLEMDKKAGYSFLRLQPGNNLWVCTLV